jgi:hypothetical protein
VLVEDVDDHALVVTAVDGGPKHPFGVGADLAAKDDLHVGGPAQVEVVGDERLEEAAGVAGRVEHDGAGDLDLAHRALPPVAAIPVRRAQRQRQTSKPTLHEHVDGGRPEPVADRLEPLGSAQAANPLDSSVTASPALAAWRLAHSWPLTQILIG